MKLYGIKNELPALTFEEILSGQNDPHGLLKNIKPKNSNNKIQSALVSKFDEINQFIDQKSRLPEVESTDITEMILAESLHSIIEKHSDNNILRQMDRHNLLTKAVTSVATNRDINMKNNISEAEEVTSLEDIFNVAGDLLKDNSGIFELKHIPKIKQNKEMPDDVAERKECPDFWRFKPLFIEMHQKLKDGEFQLQKFSNNSQIREGDFFILKGVACFVDSIAKESEREDVHNPRMRLIFENGLESNMLMRSLAASLYKEDNGRRILQGADAVTESLLNISHKDKPLGYLYILRSLNNNPSLAIYENLYKIGFTTTTIEDRIKNAENDIAFLEAPVELVKFFECRHVNPHKLERLTHTFLEAQRLKVTLIGKDGSRYQPQEWFNVSLETIIEVVKKISDGTINQYRMNNTTGEVVRK